MNHETNFDRATRHVLPLASSIPDLTDKQREIVADLLALVYVMGGLDQRLTGDTDTSDLVARVHEYTP